MDLKPTFCYYSPCTALKDFVSSYMIAYGNFNQSFFKRPFPVFPEQNLVFSPIDPVQYSIDGNTYYNLPKTGMLGPRTQCGDMGFKGEVLTIKVGLLPGALHRLTRVPLHEILNQPFEGEDRFNNEIRKVNEQLGEAGSYDKMISIVENFLIRKVATAKEALPIDEIFRIIMVSPGGFTIDELAGMSCLSVRQFERVFLDRLGLSPTIFIRQARFNSAYHLKRAKPKMTWTSIAYECGYFDQMHLIKDFKAFTSYTPYTYFNSILPPIIGRRD